MSGLQPPRLPPFHPTDPAFHPMVRPLDQSAEHTMSFGDHLEELRKRLMLAIIVPIPLAVLALPFTDTLIEILLLPLFRALAASGLPQSVQALGPAEVVLAQIKLCVLVAVVISAPWMLYQAWLFIRPGLYQHERRFVHLLLPGSAILTVSGVLLLYYLMLPVMLTVMISIGAGVKLHTAPQVVEPRIAAVLALQPTIELRDKPPESPTPGEKWMLWTDLTRAFIAVPKDGGGVEALPLPVGEGASVAITQQFRLSEYIGFVLMMTLGTVVGFQMPLVVMLLGWIGVASPAWFRSQRKYAFFGCAVAAAVITPSSDMISMLVMLVPLYALYELGILLLVIAPASKVAEGRVFSLPRWSFGRRTSADKQAAQTDSSTKSAQSDRTVARGSIAAGAPQDDAADGPESRP